MSNKAIHKEDYVDSNFVDSQDSKGLSPNDSQNHGNSQYKFSDISAGDLNISGRKDSIGSSESENKSSLENKLKQMKKDNFQKKDPNLGSISELEKEMPSSSSQSGSAKKKKSVDAKKKEYAFGEGSENSGSNYDLPYVKALQKSDNS